MGTQTLLPVEEYLRTSYEPSREYVRGELVERGVPTSLHSLVQMEIGYLFRRVRDRHRLHACPELHLRISPDVIRIADLAVFHPEKPSTPIPSEPPLIVIEIVSPGDGYSSVTEKLAEYHAWGVPNVWLVDPQLKKLYVYAGSLREADAFELSLPPLRLAASEIFA